MKVCTKCKIEKPLDNFGKYVRGKDGLKPRCKSCSNEDKRDYYLKNREVVNSRQVARARYSEKTKAYRREYWKTRRSARLEIERRYIRNNAEVTKVKNQRRRFRKFGAESLAVTAQELQRLLSQPCFACRATNSVTIDHLIPLARGGRHSIGNLTPLCQSCNSSKGSMLWIEWRTSNRPRALEVFAA